MIEQRKTGPSRTSTTGPRPGRAARGRAWFAATLAAGAVVALPAIVLAQAAAPAAKPDPAKADKIAQDVCAACHGPDGNSTAPINPKLAGQIPEYLYKQLMDFKVQDGQKAAARPNPVMSAFASTLTDADMHNLAAYYASKPLKPSAARNKDTVGLGQEIYRAGLASKGIPACAACHGPRGEGVPAQYPLLHGQYSDYTESQLVAFRSGARHNSVPMVTIAGRMSDNEIKAVSDFIAGLR